jgi:hypothetical protein
MNVSGSAGIQEKICRLCLSDAGVILPIFDGEVAERFSVPLPMKIRACVSIDVSNFTRYANHRYSRANKRKLFSFAFHLPKVVNVFNVSDHSISVTLSNAIKIWEDFYDRSISVHYSVRSNQPLL